MVLNAYACIPTVFVGLPSNAGEVKVNIVETVNPVVDWYAEYLNSYISKVNLI